MLGWLIYGLIGVVLLCGLWIGWVEWLARKYEKRDHERMKRYIAEMDVSRKRAEDRERIGKALGLALLALLLVGCQEANKSTVRGLADLHLRRSIAEDMAQPLCVDETTGTSNFNEATGTLTRTSTTNTTCTGLPTPAPPCPSPEPCPTPMPTPTPSATPTPPTFGRVVLGYYAGWFWDWQGTAAQAVAAVDPSTFTHLIFGRYAPGGGTLGGVPGALIEGAGTGHAQVEAPIIAKTHAAGKVALLMLGGANDGPGFVASTTPAVLPSFVAAVAAKVSAKGYDGVDVDWEENRSTPTEQAQALAFLDALRTALGPSAVITWPDFWGTANSNPVTAFTVSVAQRVDYISTMTYAMAGDYGGWDSWHHAALDGAGPKTPSSVALTLDQYAAKGIPKAKIVAGIGLYGIYYTQQCGVTGPRQPIAQVSGCVVQLNDVENNYDRMLKDGLLTSGAQAWDSLAFVPYVSFVPAWARYGQSNPTRISYVSYEDALSIAWKGYHVQLQGFGGGMVWVMNYGFSLMPAVRQAFLSGDQPAPPNPSPSPTPSPTPTPSSTPTPTPTPTATPSSSPTPPQNDQGYGSVTKGGEGGDSCEVSTLADSGAGSFRDCVLQGSGPRVVTCTPGLSGDVVLLSPVVGKMPYRTVDFRACPSLALVQPIKQHAFKVGATHDWIVRGMRMRGLWKPGDAYSGVKDTGVFTIDGDAAPLAVAWDPNPTACGNARSACRIVVDGVSISGSSDAGIDTWCGVRDLTVQNILVFDSFHPWSMGCDTQAGPTDPKRRERITVFGSVMAFNGERQPKLLEGAREIHIANHYVYAQQNYALPGGTAGYGLLIDNDGNEDNVDVTDSAFLPEVGGTQGAICKSPNFDNLGGNSTCRNARACQFGALPKCDGSPCEANLRAKSLYFARNLFGPQQNPQECVSTATGQNPHARPYTLPIVALTAANIAAVEAQIMAAGPSVKTPREAFVLGEVVKAVKRKLGVQ